MADASNLVIPADTQAAFGELIDLIKQSESMNDEERQYWINILPIMTPEQVQNLRDILTNEKQQLAAIDAKYAQQAGAIPGEEELKEREQHIQQQRLQRQSAEEAAASQESGSAEDILKQIEKS